MQLVSSVKVRILKPLDRDWDDIGPRLRDLAWLGHRVLNGTISRLALSSALPEQVPDTWRSRRNENSEKRPGGKPSAYQMSACAIDEANLERVKVRVCAWCNGSGVEPGDAPVDKRGKAIKATKAQLKRERIAGQICARCDGAKEYRAGEPIEVPSVIQLGWCRMAERRYMNDRGDIARGAKSIPSYRSPAPIAVTSSGSPFSLSKDDYGYVLSVPLYPGGASGCVRFALKPDGPSAFVHLNRLTEATSKVGDLKILQDDNKWLAVISYTWEREEVPARSAPDAVVSLSEDGSPEIHVSGRAPKRLYEGLNIERKRRIFSMRRAARSKHQRDIGKGARGHGRARALEHYHAVDDAEGRWLKSICQEIAAKAAKEAEMRGSRWVAVDDKLTVLPPAQLRDAIKWALLKRGFVEPPEYKTKMIATEQSGVKEVNI